MKIAVPDGGVIERVLRAGTLREPDGGPPPSFGSALGAIVAGGTLYGAAMGCFGGLAGDRVWQVIYSSLKVPLLLLLTTGFCLPAYCVLNTLAGLRQDLPRALAALLTSQAGSALVLAALSPYPLLWYAGSTSYPGATLFNGGMFAIASLAGQGLLRRLYAPLIHRDPRHRLLLAVWLLLFCFTGIQLAWVLRPFLGDPHAPVEFMRRESWGNAYVVVFRLLW